LFLVKAGAASGTNGAGATTYTTSDVVAVHGSPSDLWGTTWTPAQINAVNFGAVFTATKPDSTGAAHVITVDHIQITVHYSFPNAVTPGTFNSFETSTAASAITGQIYMKLVATGFALDVVAISAGAQVTTFNDSVQVDLVTGASGGAGCSGTPVSIAGTAQSVSLASGRGTTGAFTTAAALPDVRVRVRYPVAAPTVISCSTDNFAVRPTGITVTSTDAANNATSGAPTIKTGANFNLTATTGAAGYSGTPAVDNSKVVGSPNAGALGGSFAAAAPATGTAIGSSFFYSEVGNFGFSANAVYDSTFSAVDQPNDCNAGFSNALVGGKYGCSFGSTAIAMTPGTSGFGRFIPDNFDVTYNTPSITTACAAGTFSYLGQALSYATAPQMTITARSGTANGLTNSTTTNYAGAYMKLSNTAGSSLNQAPYDTQAGRYARFDALGAGTTPALDTAVLPATTADPTIGAFANGVGTLTFASAVSFVRSNATPSAPFNAEIALSLNVIDSDGVAFAANPARFGAASAGNGMAFSNGKHMRYGRLRLGNAVGSEKLDLRVPLTTEYWMGTAFATNPQDSCTSLTAQNFVLLNHQGGVTPANMVSPTGVSAGNISIGGFAAGVANLTLLKPNPAPVARGTVDVCVDLDVGAGMGDTSCQAPTPAALGPLRTLRSTPPGTYTQDPFGRAAFGTFGSQPNNFIYFRENF
jgi:MSHA biogenesis protein MshQ